MADRQSSTERPVACPGVGKLYIVRHAHAGARRPDDGSDQVRHLSDRGERQAESLGEQLGDAGITRLVSSPFTRCVETLAPLGLRLGISIEIDARLAEAQGCTGALALAEELRGETAALCSHGDVIPDLLEEVVRQGARLDDDLRWPKGSTWVLSRNGTGFSKGRYLPPPT